MDGKSDGAGSSQGVTTPPIPPLTQAGAADRGRYALGGTPGSAAKAATISGVRFLYPVHFPDFLVLVFVHVEPEA